MKHERPYGLIARLEDAETLVAAARRVRDAGYTRVDAFAPFPVEGLPEGLGLGRSPVPLYALVGGVIGATSAYGLMWYSAVIDYPWNIGGRPLHSWPSFIPITFEVMVLIAALAIFFGVVILCGLPRLYRPVFGAPGFERASIDAFFLLIAADDAKFDADETRSFLLASGALSVEEVPW